MPSSGPAPRWLFDKLRAGESVLLDGATGTELRRRGFPMSPGAWSALAAETHAPLLREIHAEYIRAGAEIITTNTFATTRFVLHAAGAADRFRTINLATIRAALEARETAAADFPVAVAGAISCLPPRFDTRAYPSERAERDGYRELAELLAGAGADLLVLEMMEEPQHARWAAEAAADTELPILLGVSCRRAPGGGLVGYDFPGIPLTRTLDALLDLRPAAVIVMHTPLDAVLPALQTLTSRWSGSTGACPELATSKASETAGELGTAEEPGAGDPHGTTEMLGAGRAAALTPEHLAKQATAWLAAGAQLLGACCGSTPAHILALRAARDTSMRE